MWIRMLLVLVTLAVAAGCGSKPKLSADQYYTDAKTAFTDKNYDVAIKSYKSLLDQYPFDEHAEEAELQIALSHYKNKQYPEAVAAFNDFQRMHPMSPALPQVYYLLGRSYMDQMTTIDRDQAASENAHGWFRVVIDRYPDSPYAAKARRRLAECRAALAGHELYIARYYFRLKNLRAGENRVKGILENYPETPVTTRALEQLADAYARAGDREHEQMARAAVAERQSGGASDVAQDPPGESAVRAGNDAAPTGLGSATVALLDDLTVRYGPAQGLSTVATAPALVDPVVNKPTTSGDPRYGPGPNTPMGGD